ncbi:hypothetical protein E5288_WYG011573 [Bos mutus]|uniref:Uncharacterized protein n=1 Tax=Bos mutus TaxID=72004 RepID=A0A6B0RHZ0_9CETA|nr:hypothetical protein [Bos mutus]
MRMRRETSVSCGGGEWQQQDPRASRATGDVDSTLNVTELQPEGMKLSFPAAVWRTDSRRADRDKVCNVPC